MSILRFFSLLQKLLLREINMSRYVSKAEKDASMKKRLEEGDKYYCPGLGEDVRGGKPHDESCCPYCFPDKRMCKRCGRPNPYSGCGCKK